MNAALLIPIVAALAAPVLGYLAAARRLSGRIKNSDAADLWEEARAIRKEYRDQITALERIIDRLRERIVQLEAENADLRTKLRAVT